MRGNSLTINISSDKIFFFKKNLKRNIRVWRIDDGDDDFWERGSCALPSCDPLDRLNIRRKPCPMLLNTKLVPPVGGESAASTHFLTTSCWRCVILSWLSELATTWRSIKCKEAAKSQTWSLPRKAPLTSTQKVPRAARVSSGHDAGEPRSHVCQAPWALTRV